MKKKLCYFIFFLIVSAFGFSQNLSPSIISSQGSFDEAEGITLEWTLGESIIETINHQNEIYTQGFHQPFIYSRLEIQDHLNAFNIVVSPNPVNAIVNISVDGNYNSQLIIHLFDVNGKIIKKTTSSGNYNDITLNVIELSSGIYILKISDIDGTFVETHKIIKY